MASSLKTKWHVFTGNGNDGAYYAGTTNREMTYAEAKLLLEIHHFHLRDRNSGLVIDDSTTDTDNGGRVVMYMDDHGDMGCASVLLEAYPIHPENGADREPTHTESEWYVEYNKLAYVRKVLRQ